MAIVRGPFHSMDASGVCGPLVAVRGARSGGMRGWSDLCDPKSPLQTWNRRAVFSQAAAWWYGAMLANGGKWLRFAETWAGEGCNRRGVRLTARDWFMRFQVRRFRYGMGLELEPPPSPGCEYSPGLTCEWTSPGIILTWSIAIPVGGRIVVRQARNEKLGRMGPVGSRVSHIFDESESSPQNISGPVGGPAEPSDWAVIAGMCSQHVQVFCLDSWARKTPVRNWLLYS